MKIYKSNFGFWYFLFLIMPVCIYFSYIWKINAFPFEIFLWILSFIAVLLRNTEKRISKIIVDINNGEITLLETSDFNTDKKIFKFPIVDVSCSISEGRTARGASSKFRKIDAKSESFPNFSANLNDFSYEDIQDLIKRINRYKSSVSASF
jgi:hypothetical protein